MKVALVTSCFVARDGVGNTIRDKLDAFAAWGWTADLYHQQTVEPVPGGYRTRHLELPDLIEERLADAADGFFDHDLFLVEYLCWYPLMESCRLIHQGRLVVEYPGITPSAHYVRSDPFHRLTEEALAHLGLLDRADAVLVHSTSMRDELLGLHPLPPERVLVLPPGVGSAFVPGPASSTLRGRLAPGGGPLLLFVGRLTGNKRVDLLVQALASLMERFPGVRLVLAGDHGRPEVAHYRPALESLARALGVSDRLLFETGPDDRALAELYRSADVFVTASLHEGFGIPVAEALSCGTPVVVPRATALPETAGRACLTCDPDSPQDLAWSIARVLEDPALRAQLQARALEESRRFTPAAFRARLRSALDAVLAAPPRLAARADAALDLLDAATPLAVRYEDRLVRGPLARLVRWFRRRVTFPLEVSVVRALSRQQTLWNRLLVAELRRLRAEVRELRRRLGEGE